MSRLMKLSIALFSIYFLAGCAASQMKARKEQRDKASQTSKIYCEFINGETFPDIDVAMNLEMSKRCDSNKPTSMTSYRSPSEAVGIVYCCTIKDKEDAKKPEGKTDAKTDKSNDKSDLKLDDLDSKSSTSTGSSSPSTPSSQAPKSEVKTDPTKAEKK